MMKRNCADALVTNTRSVLPSQERMEQNGAKVVRLREAGCSTKRSFSSLNGNIMRRQES
jgi:hypothetical protein